LHGADDDARGAVRLQPAPGRIEARAGVDDHAGWVATGRAPHGKLRIIGGDRSGADDDGVDLRPQAVQMVEPLGAIDVAGLPTQRRNAAVKRLAELRDDKGATRIGARDSGKRFGRRRRRIDRRQCAGP